MFRRRPDEPLIETVLVESGRIRLFERHLLRLRRSGATPKHVTGVRALAETWRRTAGRATVVRFEVEARTGVASRARTPPSCDPVALALVPGFDPTDASRERKLADRAWADRAEAAARSAGADEPLLHDDTGLLGETSRASLFVVDATGRIRTPPARGILPGVTREWVLATTDAAEHPLTVEDLAGTRAAFVTTAARGVVPVVSVDGRALGTDDRVSALAAAWRALR